MKQGGNEFLILAWFCDDQICLWFFFFNFLSKFRDDSIRVSNSVQKRNKIDVKFKKVVNKN